MAHNTLGVVSISYNEERDLPRFLEHLLPWIDEIILIDDGSTDSTREIAEAGGDKVTFIESPRKDAEYFSHQRNKGIAAAKSDWLLHMDIDERVPPALAEEILAAIDSEDFDAYRYRRLNYFLHRPMRFGAWQNWNLVHLARRDKFHFGGKFHETCIVDALDARIGQLKTTMHHLNDESYTERLRKSDSYLVELADPNQSKPLSTLNVVWAACKEFLYRYFYKQGFRDGGLGLLSALHTATAVFRANFLVWDKQHRISRESIEDNLEAAWASAPIRQTDDATDAQQ